MPQCVPLACGVYWPGLSSRSLACGSGAVCRRRARRRAQAPTFNRDVAPILYANCVTCHRPDGIAPMTLTTFAAAKAYATRVREVTASREMPPWYADPQHGQFKNARGLTQAQIDTLSRWAEGGAPEGAGAAPAAPTFPSNGGWDARMNRAPDLVLDLPFGEYELPASGEVPTFTVWMKLPLREDRFVQALEIKPSLRHVVSSLEPGARHAPTGHAHRPRAGV